MLVFVWNAAAAGPAAFTEACVLAACPGCRCVRLAARPAAVLNRELAGDGEPFFLILEAGDAVAPDFFVQAQPALDGLAEDAAGLILAAAEPPGRCGTAAEPPPRAAAFWRAEAVRSGAAPGFAEPALLPFEAYVPAEKKLQLERRWTWATFRTSAYRPHSRRLPGWRRAGVAWRYLAPLLAAPVGASPAVSAAAAASPPLFTVALCTYNNADYLPWAIRSVCAQSRPDWELIVADDGSTDGTAAALRQCPLLRDRRIKVCASGVNRGKAACLNRVLAAARGRWLLELDADDWLAPDCLETLARAAAAAGDAGALCGEHVEWRELADRLLVPGDVRRATAAFAAAELLDRPFALAPRAYETALLKELAGWWTHDPYGGRLYEDVQMLVRVARRRPLLRVPAPLYHRRIRRASVTQRSKARYAAWRAWMEAQLAAER